MQRSSKSTPLISIIVPTYNVAGCLERAVHSALAQTHRNIEIIIVDDASTDNTVDIARAIAKHDSRILVLPQLHNAGPSVARNIGIGAASGDWIAVLDADDAFKKNRLANLIHFTQRNECDVVADDLVLYDQGLKQELSPAFGWSKHHRLTMDLLLSRDKYLRGSPLGWIKPMFRRSYLIDNQIRYPHQYRHAEDFYLLSSLLLTGARFWLLPEAGYIYTLRMGSISQKASPFSASAPNMDSIAASCLEISDRYQDKLTRRQKRGLLSRKRRFENGRDLDLVYFEINSGRKLRAASLMLTKPGATLLLVEKLSRSVLSRTKNVFRANRK